MPWNSRHHWATWQSLPSATDNVADVAGHHDQVFWEPLGDVPEQPGHRVHVGWCHCLVNRVLRALLGARCLDLAEWASWPYFHGLHLGHCPIFLGTIWGILYKEGRRLQLLATPQNYPRCLLLRSLLSVGHGWAPRA